MNRAEFIKEMDESLKLVRTEYGLTQDKMAVCIGLSKKTLVEIEKGRSSLGWSGAVTLSAVFSESSVLQNRFGGEMSDMVKALAFESVEVSYPKTMGGKVWWRVVEQTESWKIQQNYVSGHYRLLTADDCRVCSSFKLEDVKEAAELIEKRDEK